MKNVVLDNRVEETKTKWMNQDVWVFSVLYLVAHCGILFIPNAIYWDDWVLYRADPLAVIERFSQQAGTLFYLEGYLHLAMLRVGPWLYKFLTFFLMLGSGLLLNSILKRHEKLSPETRFLIVLLFMLLPFNMARVALVDFRYTACYFLFFLAWRLMDRHRLIALILFATSFNTNSILMFYAMPVLDLLYREKNLQSWKSVLKSVGSHADFIVLPLAFFAVKIYYFSPTGIYAGYNQGYSLKNLAYLPAFQFFDFFKLDVNVGFALLFSLLTFFLIRQKFAKIPDRMTLNARKNFWTLLILGLLMFVLGAFPYWILGLLPTFDEWSSRHQLLMPLGSALIIVALFSFGNLSKKAGIISTVVGVSLAYSVSSYVSLFADWQKQQQLIALFSANEEIKRAELILIDDNATKFNALNRHYRFYEWNGMLEMAFGAEGRFAIASTEYERYLAGAYDSYMSSSYKAEGFRRDAVSSRALVTIDVSEPESFSGKLVGTIFPKFKLSVRILDRVAPFHQTP